MDQEFESDVSSRLLRMTMSRSGVSLADVTELADITEVLAQYLSTGPTVSRSLAAAMVFFAFESRVAPGDDEVLMAWTEATDNFAEMLGGPGELDFDFPSPRPARSRTQPEIIKFATAVVRRHEALLAGSPKREAMLRDGLNLAKRFLEIARQDHPSRDEMSQLIKDLSSSGHGAESSFAMIEKILETLLNQAHP